MALGIFIIAQMIIGFAQLSVLGTNPGDIPDILVQFHHLLSDYQSDFEPAVDDIEIIHNSQGAGIADGIPQILEKIAAFPKEFFRSVDIAQLEGFFNGHVIELVGQPILIADLALDLKAALVILLDNFQFTLLRR